MAESARYDAIVVGSGPNGLAAAITLARKGCSVLVLEAEKTIGGGARTAELTIPGFRHDVCSAVHPMGAASPFFRELPLAENGLEWIEPPFALAHPFDDGTAAVLERSLERTAAGLGVDGSAYCSLMRPLVDSWRAIESAVLGRFVWPPYIFALARFGLRALRPAERLAVSLFQTEAARALLAGIAAHGMVPLDKFVTSSFGLMLGGAAHLVSWPIPRGGSQSVTEALAGHLRSLGGEIVSGTRVRSLDELPPTRAVLCDLSPRPFLEIAGKRFPPSFGRKLRRYRYGPGAFKVDWALHAPIPWRASECARAGTVHLGGTLAEIAAAERAAWEGRSPERPFLILAQPSLFDSSRAPAGKHTAWAYCHVPNGSTFDMLPRLESQVERFAPGFRDCILARHVMTPAWIEQHNPNLVGGDIAAGAPDLAQFFTRPTRRLYSTPCEGLYICSSATPPGPGVHGLCGYFAARAALKHVLRG